MIKALKKITFSFFLLYSFNLFSVNFNYIIPINVVTIGIVTILGIPGMITLCLFSILI